MGLGHLGKVILQAPDLGALALQHLLKPLQQGSAQVSAAAADLCGHAARRWLQQLACLYVDLPTPTCVLLGSINPFQASAWHQMGKGCT